MRADKFVRTLLVVLTLCVITGPAHSQPVPTGPWTSANGPNGTAVSLVSLLAIDPTTSSTVYACGYDGMFKTTNSGAEWVRVGPIGAYCAALAIDPVHPSVLYAQNQTGESFGFIKTTDGGATWTRDVNGFGRGLAVAPDSSALYIANGSGIKKSIDGGASWTPRVTLPAPPDPTKSNAVGVLSVDPATPTKVYAGTPAGIYRSLDAGASWLPPSYSGMTNTDVRCLLVSGSAVYAGTVDGLFVSVDDGQSWTQAGAETAGQWIVSLAAQPETPATVYAAVRTGTSYALLKSTNGGTSWTTLSSSLGAIVGVYVEPGAPRALYVLGTVGASRAVLRSVDGGSSWALRNNGLETTQVRSMTFDPHSEGRLFAGTNGSIFSLDWPSGAWETKASGLGSIWQMAFMPSVPGQVYAADFCRGVRRSTDGGASWAFANDGLTVTCVEGLVVDPTTPTTVYASTNDGIYKSVNSGDLWFPINNGTSPTSGTRRDFQAIAIDPVTPTTLYVGGTVPDHAVYKTTDGGANWTWMGPFPSTPSGYYVWKVVVDPVNPSTVYVAADGVYKTTDGGATWSLVGFAGRIVWTLLLDPLIPNVLYAGLQYDNRVYRSADGGATWQPIGDGLPPVAIASLAMDPTGSTLFAGTNGEGIYYLPIPRNQAPTAEAGSNRTVLVGETVSFDGTGSSDGDGTIATWQWAFGDGTVASGSVLTHVYAAPGTFTVTLTVTDDDGATGSDTAAVVVQTLSQGVGSLTQIVASYNIQQGVASSLDAKLQNAQGALDAVNAGQRQDAANKLLAFINAVDAQRGKQLTNQQADDLIAQTNRILALL